MLDLRVFNSTLENTDQKGFIITQGEEFRRTPSHPSGLLIPYRDSMKVCFALSAENTE